MNRVNALNYEWSTRHSIYFFKFIHQYLEISMKKIKRIKTLILSTLRKLYCKKFIEVKLKNNYAEKGLF